MNIKKFDVVLTDFSGGVGEEQIGIRPAIVFQNDIGNLCSPLTIVIPLSSKKKNRKQPTHTLIRRSKDTGLVQDSIALGEQIKAISKQRIIKKIGTIVNERERNEIRRACLASFGE